MFISRLLIFCLLLGTAVSAADSPSFNYQRTENGVLLFTDPRVTGTVQAVRVEVIADNIIRVHAVEGKQFPPDQSLVVLTTKSATKFSVEEKGTDLLVKTASLNAVIARSSGAVSFYDSRGKKIVAEKKAGGRAFTAAVYEGQPSYQLQQHFELQPDEAIFGLGQHQDGLYNYRGRQVYFFQNNTEVAIPFLVSTNNYGILWDNYSLTTAGDIRSFRPLSALQLQDVHGRKGWLSASYFATLTADKPAFQRAESEISMEFLGDSKRVLPDGFKAETGKVQWEGSIASPINGIHQLRLSYGGTIRLWIDGKEVLNRWRKAWNPAKALLDIPLEKDKPVPFKLEWIPEGAESYCSFHWLEPLAEKEKDQFSFSSAAGKQIDYYFIYGNNMDEIISGYRQLSGKATLVPKWALGFWQSRERYKTQEELLDVVKEFRKRSLPLDNIVLDWSYWKEDEWGSQEFEQSRFPSADSLIKLLHNKYHTRFMISVWPKFYEGIKAYEDFQSKGWLYPRNIADRQRDWIGKGYVSTFYDAFNPAARKGFWDLINKNIYAKGIDAWWMDASEPDILSNVSPEKRILQMGGTYYGAAAEWLNAYPLQNAKGIYEGQRSIDSNKRVFLLTRSGFAGSQRYAATIWSGDIGSTWSDMKTQITAGINYSLSGLPYWTMDIGGFVVPKRFEQPGQEDLEEWRELNTRWFQFGAFVPLFRSHGQFPFREPYNIAPEHHAAYKSMQAYLQLRYRLLPYNYSINGLVYHKDYTLMRGLVMDFAQDTAVLKIDDQYMFGPSLLICPVTSYKARERSVYLPSGKGWYDLYTGRFFSGGQSIKAPAPYEQMPVFVPEGAILPMGPALQYTTEKVADTITLFVYKGRDGAFALYEDDGLNYDYEHGKFSNIPITYKEASNTLIIGNRAGTYPGMLSKRVFRIVAVASNNAAGFNPASKVYRTVRYNGKELSIKL